MNFNLIDLDWFYILSYGGVSAYILTRFGDKMIFIYF